MFENPEEALRDFIQHSDGHCPSFIKSDFEKCFTIVHKEDGDVQNGPTDDDGFDESFPDMSLEDDTAEFATTTDCPPLLERPNGRVFCRYLWIRCITYSLLCIIIFRGFCS